MQPKFYPQLRRGVAIESRLGARRNKPRRREYAGEVMRPRRLVAASVAPRAADTQPRPARNRLQSQFVQH